MFSGIGWEWVHDTLVFMVIIYVRNIASFRYKIKYINSSEKLIESYGFYSYVQILKSEANR